MQKKMNRPKKTNQQQPANSQKLRQMESCLNVVNADFFFLKKKAQLSGSPLLFMQF